MSYIELLESVPSSKKLVLSVWFKIPAESIAAAKSDYALWSGSSTPREALTGIIPLVVFGGPRLSKEFQAPGRSIEGNVPSLTRYAWNYGTCDRWTDFFTIPGSQAGSTYFVFDGDTHAIDPSHIGVDCTGDVPKLSINIVMPEGDKPTFRGSWPLETAFSCSVDSIGEYNAAFPTDTCDPGFDNHTEDDGSPCWFLGRAAYIMPFNEITYTVTYGDSGADVVMGCRPEAFRTLPADALGEVTFSETLSPSSRVGGKEITPDTWHHLLLSLDLTKGCRTTGSSTHVPGTEGIRTSSSCRMFISFDDVNLTESALTCYWPPGSSDKNAIITVNGFYVAGEATISGTTGPTDDCWGNNVTRVSIQTDIPSYSYSPSGFDIGTIAIPAPSVNVSKIKHCEMAEFQMFTDVTLDTSLERVRRAFITESGRPASLSLSKKLIGKDPEVLIHKSSNWKIAKNTGSLADRGGSEGTAVGNIKRYKPDPRLGR